MRRSAICLATVALVTAMTVGLGADVKSKQKTQVKFEGMLGRMVGMFGGKAAKEGIVSTVSLAGDRQMTVTDQTGELIDLAAEKVYHVDFKGRSYKVQTFAEIRKEWQDAQAKMKEESAKNKEKGGEVEFEIDVDVQRTDQQKTINGHACQQVIVTLTVRPKGQTLEQGGGMVIKADSWLGPKIPAMAEQLAFQQRYIQQLFGTDAAGMAQGLAQAMAMYPQMKDGMARMQKEAGKLDGTAILTVMTMESVQTAEQAQARAGQDKPSAGGIGGIAGGLGGMFGKKKKADEPAKDGQAPAGAKNRATIMTSTTELLSVETSVAPADVEIPAGFKQK